jgi:hypothetical protein
MKIRNGTSSWQLFAYAKVSLLGPPPSPAARRGASEDIARAKFREQKKKTSSFFRPVRVVFRTTQLFSSPATMSFAIAAPNTGTAQVPAPAVRFAS